MRRKNEIIKTQNHKCQSRPVEVIKDDKGRVKHVLHRFYFEDHESQNKNYKKQN